MSSILNGRIEKLIVLHVCLIILHTPTSQANNIHLRGIREKLVVLILKLTYCRSQNLPQILFKIIFFKYFSKTKIEKITMVFPHVITKKLTTGTPIKQNSHQEKWRCKRSNHKPLIKKKDRQNSCQKKMDKMANIDSKNKPLDRKLKIEQQNQLKKPGVNSGAPDGK